VRSPTPHDYCSSVNCPSGLMGQGFSHSRLVTPVAGHTVPMRINLASVFVDDTCGNLIQISAAA
jgi:hypothetical protein